MAQFVGAPRALLPESRQSFRLQKLRLKYTVGGQIPIELYSPHSFALRVPYRPRRTLQYSSRRPHEVYLFSFPAVESLRQVQPVLCENTGVSAMAPQS